MTKTLTGIIREQIARAAAAVEDPNATVQDMAATVREAWAAIYAAVEAHPTDVSPAVIDRLHVAGHLMMGGILSTEDIRRAEAMADEAIYLLTPPITEAA